MQPKKGDVATTCYAKDRQTDTQTDRQKKQTDRQTDRQKNRQTDTHTHTIYTDVLLLTKYKDTFLLC